jgi:hypothetical protein
MGRLGFENQFSFEHAKFEMSLRHPSEDPLYSRDSVSMSSIVSFGDP